MKRRILTELGRAVASLLVVAVFVAIGLGSYWWNRREPAAADPFLDMNGWQQCESVNGGAWTCFPVDARNDPPDLGFEIDEHGNFVLQLAPSDAGEAI